MSSDTCVETYSRKNLGDFMTHGYGRMYGADSGILAIEVVAGTSHEGAGQGEDGDGGRPLGLTPRELQVLGGIREGLSNRKVGRNLGISERTVKVHLHSIFIKLGATSRTQAVVQGIRSGCISI